MPGSTLEHILGAGGNVHFLNLEAEPALGNIGEAGLVFMANFRFDLGFLCGADRAGILDQLVVYRV